MVISFAVMVVAGCARYFEDSNLTPNAGIA
jgi:hypothetical protein